MVWISALAAAIIILVLAWFLANGLGVAIVSSIYIALGVVYLLYRFCFIHLNEMEVGVLFDRDGNFSRFIDSGHHFINPLAEHLTDKLPKGPQSSKGTAQQIRTREGIPVSIQWDVSFFIDVRKILPGIEHKMARALPKYAVNMVGGRILHSLRHLVEEMSIEELHTKSSIKQLEEALRQEVSRRVKNLGILEIDKSDVKLGPIMMPPNVEKALEANYELKLRVEALDLLQQVIGKFTDTHMARLGELERLRILDNGDTQFYMMETYGKGEAAQRPSHGPRGQDVGVPMPAPGPDGPPTSGPLPKGD